MAQFDYQGLVSGGRCGSPTYHEMVDDSSSLARDGWPVQDSRTSEGDSKLFHNVVLNTNVVDLITNCIEAFDAIAGVVHATSCRPAATCLSTSARLAMGRYRWTTTLAPRTSHLTPSETFRSVKNVSASSR